MSDKATLREVARAAGISLGTASQALNNRPGVSPATRARVLEAAASLGYQPQVRLPTPVTVHLNTVGMVVKSFAKETSGINPFYSHVLAGAERECQRHNLNLMYANIEIDALNRALSWPPMLLNNSIDGLMIVGTFLEDTIAEIARQTGLPLVLIDAYAPGQRFDGIVSDNLNGAYMAVTYLIEQGHTRIGLIGSTQDAYPSIRERRQGYLNALKYHGIADIYIEESTLLREGGYDATCRLMRRFPDITAIFACNDDVAIGALNAARDLGLRVPDDLSLIGFDDIDLAQEITPPLTTVHVDKALMGSLAVRYLRDRAENPNRPVMTTALGTSLVVRKSVRYLLTPD